jgi:aminopeptidase N
MNAESSDTEMSLDETNPERKKYFVNGDRGSSSSSGRFCQKSLTRREWICVIIGATIVAMAIVLFIVIALAFASPMGGTADNQGEPWTEIRLPVNLVPQLYTIYLDPDLDTRAVTGTVSMEVFVQLATNNVIFHAKDMNIHRDSVVVTRNSAPLQISNQFNYSTNDFYIITLASQLNANETIIVSMSFNYTLRDDLVGFYRSSYISNNGDKVYLASTQFEPTDARRAFPCFDEPDLKANFSIQLTHPPGYSAVSNMPVKTSQTVRSESTKMKTLFETTYKMSTYLVAFVVSNFECSIPDNSSAIKVRVCSRADVFNSTSYALHVAKIVINYYEEFFDVKYPLPKQDLFAIPDFAAGAMENWGLITYRETAVLYDKSINPAASKQRVTVVIAHELAHQWFGNLVTMEWWDGLWLNEGFASYVEYIGANEAEPSWMMLDQFFHTVQTAFDADGLNWSHPIIQTVDNPDQINALFDSISYSKGASLIQMLRGYLGEDNFRSGLKIYLKAHQFANARTSDLWTALNQVTSHLYNLT